MDGDSIDKIVTRYFACVTDEEFTYKGKTYKPRPLHISPLIFRGYTCPAVCGACCTRFSLDYLPQERHPDRLDLKERLIAFNGYKVPIWSDMQTDHSNHHCRNLSMDNGRCGIHGQHPFSCDFELIRFLHFADLSKPNRITQKLYGRGHAMLRIDGERGARCEMLQPNDEHKAEVVRKLGRLKQWCEHFGLKHRVDLIIAWAENPTAEDILPPEQGTSMRQHKEDRMSDNGSERLNGTEAPRRKRVGRNHFDRPIDASEVDPYHQRLSGWGAWGKAEDVAVREHARKITTAYRKTVESVIETGKLLNNAKEALDHGQWGHMLAYLPFGDRQAQMLMAVAGHPVLSNPQYVADLPASWATLYELAGLTTQQVEEAIKSHDIRASMTRKDARLLCESRQTTAKQNATDLLTRLYLFTTYTTPQELLDHQDGLTIFAKSPTDEWRQLGAWVLEVADLIDKRREDRAREEKEDWEGAAPSVHGAANESEDDMPSDIGEGDEAGTEDDSPNKPLAG